jgi:hypothetical protein
MNPALRNAGWSKRALSADDRHHVARPAIAPTVDSALRSSMERGS